ncbi:MAG: response regulator [Chloroflexota bacterium]
MAHIYVVDDDDQLLRMVGLMLERGGHTATLVSSPIEALELIKEDVPDLAILDVMMPGMNGLELCRELRADQTTKDLPIIILTARGPAEERDHAFEGGADEYLTKPVTSQELLENVEHLLANRPAERVNGVNGVSSAEDEASHDHQAISKSIALFGFSGGTGRTTLAVNLAIALEKESSQPVYLVDFTTSGGQSAMHMRLQPRLNWSNLNSTTNLSWNELEGQLLTHSSGVSILPAPTFPINPNLPATGLAERIITLLSEQNGLIVIDLPAYLSPMVKNLLGMVDVALHVFTPDVVSVQTAVRSERILRENEAFDAKRRLMLNHTTADAQLSQPTVERGMNATIDHGIDFDPNQSRAMAQGTPLSQTSAVSSIPKWALSIARELMEEVTA